MRRLARRRPAYYKSPRLFTMCALLVCLAIMMNSLRTFREPGQDAPRILSNLDQPLHQVNQAASQEPTEPAAEDSSTETGEPNQPVAEESNADAASKLNLREDLFLQDQLGLVQDGTLELQKLEMPSYWSILGVVKNATFETLFSQADSKVRFNELYSSASKNRSRLLSLTVNIRRVTRYETESNPAGVEELFEVWGWSETSKAWLYVFVTPELPAGLDANSPVNQTAKFAGYFYKLQGYHPGAAKPDAKPQLAPLLIGKFELTQPAKRTVDVRLAPIEWIAGGVILVLGVLAIFLRMFVFNVRKPKVRRAAPTNFGNFPEGFIDNSSRTESDDSDRR